MELDSVVAAPLTDEDSTLRRLMAHLLNDDLVPGMKLPPERQLCELLGCSRTALREVIGQLSFIGVLASRRGSGTYFCGVDSSLLPEIMAWVMQFGETDLGQVIDARWSFEVMAVGLAAQRRSSAQLRQLGHHLAGMREASDAADFTESDTAFHDILIEATDNTVLSALGQSIHAIRQLWIGQNLAQLDDVNLPYPEHRAIFDAVTVGDPYQAQQAMHLHMARAVLRLRSTLAEEVYSVVAARSREHLLSARIDPAGLL